jgi:hypothetical protein
MYSLHTRAEDIVAVLQIGRLLKMGDRKRCGSTHLHHGKQRQGRNFFPSFKFAFVAAHPGKIGSGSGLAGVAERLCPDSRVIMTLFSDELHNAES